MGFEEPGKAGCGSAHSEARGECEYSGQAADDVRGAKARADLGLRGLTAAADELRQRWNERLAGDAQAAAQIIPERHAMLCAGVGKPEEGIPAIASAIAA